MQLTSDFAIISIKAGRKDLALHFQDRPRQGPCPEHLRIPVTIVGYIDYPWGSDDGTDQEFCVKVEHLSTAKPIVEYKAVSPSGIAEFSTMPEAIERARFERSIPSGRPGDPRKASVSRSILIHEPLYSSTCKLPDPEPAP